jgi:crotonobetainyl-CoA:carnitine CoA-transferase CaiB-like acyl-CoA transferase
MIDLNTPDGLEIIHELAAQTDVVIINYRPDVAAKLGIDYATLSLKNPRLIYCDNPHLPPRPARAPSRLRHHRPGAQRPDDGRRSREGGVPMERLPSADISTGIAIAWGISAALYARERTGRASASTRC